jgi:hypothetical protein
MGIPRLSTKEELMNGTLAVLLAEGIYIGGGVLVAILIILLLLMVLRRA